MLYPLFQTCLLTDHRILAHYPPRGVPSPTGALQDPPTQLEETGGNEEVTAETDLNATSLVESKE